MYYVDKLTFEQVDSLALVHVQECSTVAPFQRQLQCVELKSTPTTDTAESGTV